MRSPTPCSSPLTLCGFSSFEHIIGVSVSATSAEIATAQASAVAVRGGVIVDVGECPGAATRTLDATGAIVTPDTLARGRALGLRLDDHLDRNDAYGFFEPLGGLVITGPTHTNVNDFRALLIL